MSRPLRIEFSGALYHVTSRGNAQSDIYLDDQDRRDYLSVLSDVCHRFNWTVHAYCLMSNHYHLLIETPDANLSQGMRQLNGVYTQSFNRAHSRVGHVFQGRYKAILVEKDNYLLELARYIVLNPVRARMVRAAKDWPWSSYRATSGIVESPDWLSTDGLLLGFAKTRRTAIKRYREFVAAGKNQPSPWEQLRNQIFLGTDQYVDAIQTKLKLKQALSEIPKVQRSKVAKPLDYYLNKCKDRNQAIVNAYQSGGYSMKEVGAYFGVHYSSVSKIIKQAENSQFKT